MLIYGSLREVFFIMGEYIKTELFVVVIMLYAIGEMIKNTEKVNNKYIPIILGVIGIIVCSVYVLSIEGFNGMSLFTSITQGVLCAATAVYGNQLIKQSSK